MHAVHGETDKIRILPIHLISKCKEWYTHEHRVINPFVLFDKMKSYFFFMYGKDIAVK